MFKSVERGGLTSATTILFYLWSSVAPLNAKEQANPGAMSLYTRIGALNVCIYRAAGVAFDKATAVAGETVAQTIRGVNGGKISEIGNNALSIEELRRGAINSVVLGSVEICPERVPLAIREKVKSVITARARSPMIKNAQDNTLNEDSVSTNDKGIQNKEDSVKSTVSTASLNPARLSASITVRIETSGPSGSGTILRKRDEKYIVGTACHVIEGSSLQEEVQIVTNDDTSHMAIRSSVVRHKNTDLCTISFASNKTYMTPELASRKPDVGDSIYVAGWSLPSKDIPSSLRVIQGVVTGSTQRTGQDGYSLIYTTNAPTLPGMSGGPIISDNKLIGIHGRAERAPDLLAEGKVMATAYSLGLSIELLE
jgi:hypothetical protein